MMRRRLRWIPRLNIDWLHVEFWRDYIFAKPRTLRKIWCRLCNHPTGVVWYNSGGFEPDMRCQNCGDDLG